MVRKSTPKPTPQAPVLTPAQIEESISRLRQCIGDLEAFDPQTIQKRYVDPQVMVLEASIRNALASTFGEDTARFNDYKIAAELDKGERVISLGPVFGRGQRVDYDALEAHNAKQYVGEGKERSIKVLKGVILELKRDLEARQARLGAQFITAQPEPLPSNKVFIVHGHDETALQGVARFIERLRLEAIILREQPNQGRTTIEKFEDYAREVGFAVVLLTPDDVVSSKTVPEQCERARQNVIFELGYFAGKLGRGRACLIRKGHVEIPSDLMGVVYLDLDEKEGWKLALVKELKAAKLQFSADRAFD